MEDNKEKIEELEKRIAEWQEELDTVWKDRNTDAAEVERRNLRNLISRSQKEIDELNGKVSEGEVKPVEETLKEIKDLKKALEEEKKDLSREIKILKNELEKLEEEKTIYEGGKNIAYEGIYEEYNKKIEEQKKIIEEKEKALEEINKKMEKYYKYNMDKILRSLTKGTQDIDKEIKDIEKQIQKKREEIEEIEYGTEGALEEVELPDGTKTKMPKVNRIYEDIKKLEEQIKGKEKSKKEIENLIKEVKGEKENTKTEFNPEQNAEVTKFFHGQGDIPENTRDDRRENDEYFGFEGHGDKKTKSRNSRDNSTTPGPEDPQPRGTGEPEDPQPRGTGESEDPQPRGTGVPEDPQPTRTEDPGQENKLPIRSFWEIYDSTNTEHCGTLARTIHYMAKAPLFNVKGQDTVGILLSTAGNILSLPVKILAKPVNAVLGTDKKFNKMYDNISKLYRERPEEFAILTESTEEANRLNGKDRRIKDIRDKDYLSPTFMKQYKVNSLYLDAVQQVYTEKQKDIIDMANKAIKSNEIRIKELQDKKNSGIDLTMDEKNELAYLGSTNAAIEQLGDKSSEKELLFRTGAEKKGRGFKEISGWFLAKNDPDNREFNHKMAELAKKRREAIERGDEDTATIISQEMDDKSRGETDIKTIGFNKNNKIDLGNTSLPEGNPCILLDKGKQTKWRDLISTTALGFAFARKFITIRDQNRLNEAIKTHNNDVRNTNQANQNIQYSGVKKFADKKDIDEAAADYSSTKVAGAHGIGEHSNLDKGANETGSGWSAAIRDSRYQPRDDALHAQTSKTMADVSSYTQAGNPIAGMEAASKYYSDVQKEAIQVMQVYAKNHNFDYNGLLDALGGPKSGQAMIDLFKSIGDGTIKYNGTVSGSMLQEMGAFDLTKWPDIALLATIGAGIVYGQQKDAKQEKLPVNTQEKEDKAKKDKDKENKTR